MTPSETAQANKFFSRHGQDSNPGSPFGKPVSYPLSYENFQQTQVDLGNLSYSLLIKKRKKKFGPQVGFEPGTLQTEGRRFNH